MHEELIKQIDPLCHVQGPGTTNETMDKAEIGVILVADQKAGRQDIALEITEGNEELGWRPSVLYSGKLFSCTLPVS